jgi:nitrogen regulatory protein PII
MVTIEAVIRPFKLDDVKMTLESVGIEHTTIVEVPEHGPPDMKAFYRGAEYRVDSPKVKLEMLVSADRADRVVNALLQIARTRDGGYDGTILVHQLADAISIRTGASLQHALP